MKTLLSNMQMIELKAKSKMTINCPVCNEIAFVDDGGNMFMLKEPYKCDHISAEVAISNYELENAPVNRYKVGSSKDYILTDEDSDDQRLDKIYEQAEQEKYSFEAHLYMPQFYAPQVNEPEDLKEFLEERKPDYYVKVKCEFVWRYFFFTKRSIGFLIDGH